MFLAFTEQHALFRLTYAVPLLIGAAAQKPSLWSNFDEVWGQHALVRFTYAVRLLMSDTAQQLSLQRCCDCV